MYIENFREGKQYDNDKSLATFDVYHNGSRYIELKVVMSAKGHKFISYPKKPRTDSSGKTVYVRYYDWGEERNKEFDKMVFEALQPFLAQMA